MKKGRSDAAEGKDLEREDDLGDVVGIGNDESRRSRDRSSDELPEEKSTEEAKSKLGLGLSRMTVGASKNESKHKGIDPQHDERGQEGPEDAQQGPLVALLNLSTGELDNEITVTSEVP